jgi:mannose-6-phosphate isomerase-like protein (cupin superfamily)
MMIRSMLLLFALGAAQLVLAQAPEDLIKQLAEDYANDPALTQPVTFGIRVDDETWTIVATPASGETAPSVTVRVGAPEVPAFLYITDGETFARIAAGDLHALTTMGQARATDPTPMTLDVVNGFEMDEVGLGLFLSVSFHFFTTGSPEVVPLGPAHALPIHGGEGLPIYYADNLRTSWYGIAPGQHINADPRDQVNDFSSLFIVIEAGTAEARIGGKDFALEDSQAIFVPAGMSHEFWNPGSERSTVILIMFGENA